MSPFQVESALCNKNDFIILKLFMYPNQGGSAPLGAVPYYKSWFANALEKTTNACNAMYLTSFRCRQVYKICSPPFSHYKCKIAYVQTPNRDLFIYKYIFTHALFIYIIRMCILVYMYINVNNILTIVEGFWTILLNNIIC